MVKVFIQISTCPYCKKNELIEDYKMCKICRDIYKLHSKERYNKNKKLGFCTRCRKNKSIINQRKCQVCKDKLKIYNKKRIQKYIKNNICILCQKNQSVEHRTVCKTCNHKKKSYNKKMIQKCIKDNTCLCCKNKKALYNRRCCYICLEKINKNGKIYHNKNKLLVFNHYGNKCKYCNLKNINILTIDHINNDGNIQRKKYNINNGSFYKWIIDNDFPDDLQTLCHNCNREKYLIYRKSINYKD